MDNTRGFEQHADYVANSDVSGFFEKSAGSKNAIREENPDTKNVDIKLGNSPVDLKCNSRFIYAIG